MSDIVERVDRWKNRFRLTVKERLELYSIPEPNSGCWLWTGFITNRGYGALSIDQRPVGAHRLAYQEEYGPIPAGAFVCHKCDVPSCVNPAHLYAGDMASNMADKANRRRVAGERHPRAKLTAVAVREIRAAVGIPYRALAEQFGISQTTIESIRARRTWKDGPDV